MMEVGVMERRQEPRVGDLLKRKSESESLETKEEME